MQLDGGLRDGVMVLEGETRDEVIRRDPEASRQLVRIRRHWQRRAPALGDLRRRDHVGNGLRRPLHAHGATHGLINGVVGDTGLEPVTSCMSSKCSNQLS